MKKMILILILTGLSPVLKAQWNKVYEFDVQMFDICFINKDTGFVCGSMENPVLMRTTDGGYTWEDITGTITSQVQSVCFLNNDTGFAGTFGGPGLQLLRTTDAGNTWENKYDNGPYLWVITFASSQVGYAFPCVMEYIYVIKTTDGGETWNQVANWTAYESGKGITDAKFSDEMNGVITSDKGYVYKTSDGGITWQETTFSQSNKWNGVSFATHDECYVSGGNYNAGRLLKSADGGSTWITSSFPTQVNDVWFVSRDTGYIATEGIMKTTDRGVSWQPDTSNVSVFPSKLYFPDQNHGYALEAGSGYSAIIKKDPDIGVGINDPGKNHRISVFPVPADDWLNLRFTLREQSTVRTELVSADGKIVITKPGESHREGQHAERLDVSSVSPGVYFLKITVNAKLFVRKIIIR